MLASSRGRTSPNSGPISVQVHFIHDDIYTTSVKYDQTARYFFIKITLQNRLNLIKISYRSRRRRDDILPPTAVRLAADLRPSAGGSAVHTSLVAGQLQAASVPISQAAAPRSQRAIA